MLIGLESYNDEKTSFVVTAVDLVLMKILI